MPEQVEHRLREEVLQTLHAASSGASLRERADRFGHSHGRCLPDRIGANNPFVTEVLTRADTLYKVATHLALQPGHHLLPALILARAVQPRHRLVLAIKLTLPLLERSITNSPLLSVAPSLLGAGTVSLHSGRLLDASNLESFHSIRETNEQLNSQTKNTGTKTRSSTVSVGE